MTSISSCNILESVPPDVARSSEIAGWSDDAAYGLYGITEEERKLIAARSHE
jgi:hypothetical protein